MRDILTVANAQRYAALGDATFDDAGQVVTTLRRMATSGMLSSTHRRGTRMRERCESLCAVAALDLSLVRLLEGHLDAQGILEEAGGSLREDQLYGVWAAEAPGAAVVAERAGSSWRLQGRKRYCSGATGLDRALITARAPDGARLFDVGLKVPGVTPLPGSWPAVGMAGSGSLDVTFDLLVSDTAEVGAPGFYLSRPGFWHGAVGVAACWLGGALGCARMLQSRFSVLRPDDHAVAHFGAIVSECYAMGTVLEHAAREIDVAEAEGSEDSGARERALLVRQVIEQGCQRVLSATGRASGSSPLAFDAAHARRAADLILYLRQHHAERDLVALAQLKLEPSSS
jgi:alkylation response protein AidB-like acyl-CoA dehydrogenase